VTRALALACLGVVLCACADPPESSRSASSNERVVSLAPGLTELVFEIGGGDLLVGVSAWSDYPREVLKLPVVGDAFSVDHEQLAMLRPDLLLVWESGTPAHTVDELRRLGYNVAVIRTRSLADIGPALLQIGTLIGRSSEATVAAERFQQQLAALRAAHQDAEPISVFYQVSARPLYTINREHWVSELIAVCGGRNIFDDLLELAPTVSVEAVVERNPEVMLASTDAGDNGFAEWQRWSTIKANLYGNQFLLAADELARPTPRLIKAGGGMCLALQRARFNRAAFFGTDEGQDATAVRDPKVLPRRRPDGPGREQPQTADPTSD
jgi:iron complex transport system substrate-binding protein